MFGASREIEQAPAATFFSLGFDPRRGVARGGSEIVGEITAVCVLLCLWGASTIRYSSHSSVTALIVTSGRQLGGARLQVRQCGIELGSAACQLPRRRARLDAQPGL